MVYYLLSEPFSAIKGLALSSGVANLMRFEDASIVACPEADDTWGFPKNRILELPPARILAVTLKGSSMRGWARIPLAVRRPVICHLLQSLLTRLEPEDSVVCQNWPYVAQAIEQSVHRAGARLIYHAHNSVAPYAGRQIFRDDTFDAIVFNSEAMRREALACMPYLAHTRVIYNGADERVFYPVRAKETSSSAPLILFVGRLVPQKGVHVLIDAIRSLNDRNIPIRCRIVGSCHAGPQNKRNTSYIRYLTGICPANVQFIGFIPPRSLGDEYRHADILCCPSIWQEPFGNVNVEAMACGLPVAATKVGGIPEIAAEGGVLLVPPGSPEALAEALFTLVTDARLRSRMGAEALASFRRRFTWARIAKEHSALVQSLAVQPSTGHAAARFAAS